MIAQRRELFDYFLDEPVCRFGLVLGDIFPDRSQIFLRRLSNPDLAHHLMTRPILSFLGLVDYFSGKIVQIGVGRTGDESALLNRVNACLNVPLQLDQSLFASLEQLQACQDNIMSGSVSAAPDTLIDQTLDFIRECDHHNLYSFQPRF
jgi:hypothetical protein